MTMIASPPPIQTRITPDQLLRMPDSVSYELVDGRLVERQMGMQSSRVGTNALAELHAFCKARGTGMVFGADAGYQCYPDAPDKVRKPDVSLILKGRLPNERAP